MKKLYTLLLLAVTSVSFGQIFSDNLNYPDNTLLTANGWTAHSGSGTNSIDVGASNGLTYAGYSGLTGQTASIEGNAARLDNTGEDVNKTFSAPITTGTLYYSFLVNVTSGDAGYFTHLGNGTTFAARIFVKPSATAGKINFGISNSGTASFAATPTDYDLNTTYLVIVKYDVSTTGAASLWIKSTGIPATEAAAGTPEHTTSGTGLATIGGVYLRQYAATQNITVDGILVYATWFGATPCALTLGAEVTACDAVTLSIDTYNISIPFTGGGAAYTLATTSGTIGGDNPSTMATGTITISGVTEGTNVTLSVSGACAFSKLITAPECKPVNTLPYSEGFPYTVGNSLNAEQKWAIANSGDNILVAAGSLTYTGVTSSGNSVTFTGTGAESFSPFTNTTAGTIYAAFLFNVSELQGLTDGNSTYFAGITGLLSSEYKARLFVKRVGEQYQIGFDTAATTTNYDATLRNVGDVVYVVIGYDFTNNTLSAWINPTNGAIPTLGVIPTPITNFGGFILRQDAANTTPTIVFDELRIVTSLADLGLTLGTQSNEIAGLKVYPNPVNDGKLYITSDNGVEKSVVIYDILGKQVVSTSLINDVVNVSGLNAGVYIVKITEEGKTATTKLIIQ